ncbi:ABC transporter substrate-binding protein [Streptomyces alkaliphilus]|uniref:ABC transporter substrate-binding protein n=2 Tax=Streptomyces alkaliphilus TaxID=1472722 RepID=A0A7W3TGB8_9ACTN|nr:ABC transporter substrate-binding protein [Streptomyces alkaliphilus]
MTPTLRRPRAARAVLSATAVCVLALTGCSSEPTDAEGSAGAPAASGADTTLRYAVAGSPATASDDPHGGLGNESDVLRFALVYDVLTVHGDDGGAEPRLATAWEPNDTLDLWTFTLRDDAEFTDGEPVRAEDVLHSLRRIGAKAAENYGRLADFDLENSRVVDEHTVELATRVPMANAPVALASITFVVPEGTEDFTGEVPGSGPYRVEESAADTAVLVRNDGWWGGTPDPERIEIRALADPQTRVDALLSGAVDVAGSVAPTAVASAEEKDMRVVRRSGVTTYPFIMRTDTAPFDDPRVREAFRLAADREELVDTVFLGYGDVANDLPTPHDPSTPTDLPQREHDVETARELLAEAGHGDGLTVTLHTTTSYPGMDTAATLYARQLQEIGVTAEVSVEPADDYWTTVYAQKPFYTGYYGGISFADLVRVGLLSESPTNETAYRSEEFDRGFEEAMATSDEARRDELLADIQRELWEDGGYVVWGTGDGIDLAAPHVHDLPDGPGFQRMFIDRVRLEG